MLHDIKHKTVGLLCLENAKQFHGTRVNVIPFKPLKNYGPKLRRFLQNPQKCLKALRARMLC
jgi:hypothetical protein